MNVILLYQKDAKLTENETNQTNSKANLAKKETKTGVTYKTKQNNKASYIPRISSVVLQLYIDQR